MLISLSEAFEVWRPAPRILCCKPVFTTISRIYPYLLNETGLQYSLECLLGRRPGTVFLLPLVPSLSKPLGTRIARRMEFGKNAAIRYEAVKHEADTILKWNRAPP